METITSFGVDFPTDNSFIDGKIRRKLEEERYELPEVLGLREFVKSSDRILEIGSGIGFISAYLAKVVGVSEILSVEANPALIGLIREVHALNGVGNAEVRNLLLFPDGAEMPATATFHAAEFLVSSSVKKPTHVASTPVEVPCARLSDIIAEFQPTGIVCDIEGAEAEIFEDVKFGEVNFLYAEVHRRKYGKLGIRKFFHDMHMHDFTYNPRHSKDGQVLFDRLPPRHRGKPFP